MEVSSGMAFLQGERERAYGVFQTIVVDLTRISVSCSQKKGIIRCTFLSVCSNTKKHSPSHCEFT